MASTKVFVSCLQWSFASQAIDAAIAQVAKQMGYWAPRPEQLEVVENFVSGRDVFFSLPTGGGKSFCFACLPLLVFYSLHNSNPSDQVQGEGVKMLQVC